MRWKFVQLTPDACMLERFEGTAEEAVRKAVTIPIRGRHIITCTDGPIAAPPEYPAAWFVRTIRWDETRQAHVIEPDAYDHGGVQHRADWLIDYYIGRLKARPCVFEVYRGNRLVQVVIGNNDPAQPRVNECEEAPADHKNRDQQ